MKTNPITLKRKLYFESFIRNYIHVFFPKWFQFIKGIKIKYRLKTKATSIAIYDPDENEIEVYHIKNEFDLCKTLLHEFAHAIDYNLNKEIGHSKKWISIINKLRKPLYLIWKGNLNSYY